MSGNLSKYSFINAKLRSRLSKILDEDFLKELASSKSLTEAVELLKNTDFSHVAEIYEKTGDLKFAELELLKKEIYLYQEIKKYLKDDLAIFVDALLLKYELEFVKNALRLWFDSNIKNRDIGAFTGYLLRDQFSGLNVDMIINASGLVELLEAFQGKAYYEVIKSNLYTIEAKKNLFSIEVALDIYYYKNLFEKTLVLSPEDRDIVKRLVGIEIDLQNITWIIRFKEFYKLPMEEALKYIIPDGFKFTDNKSFENAAKGDFFNLLKAFTEGRYNSLKPLMNSQKSDVYSKLVLIERILEEIMLYEIKKVLMGKPFNIGIIIAYFILKKSEIKKIMIVLNAKYYEIESERIMSAL